ADAVLLDGVGCVDRDLVVGLVALLDAEVVVLERHVEVGVDQGVLDLLPDDASHLIAVELDDGSFNLDLCHVCVLPLVGPHQSYLLLSKSLDVEISSVQEVVASCMRPRRRAHCSTKESRAPVGSSPVASAMRLRR